MMQEDDPLLLLTLNLKIPNLWENKLAKEFPKTKFIIQKAYPSANNSFSGLLKIENGDIPKIFKFLSNCHSNVSLVKFPNNSNVFYYSDSRSKLATILANLGVVLDWPVEFKQDSKTIKIILRSQNVSRTIDIIEKKKIKILNLSKIRINFDVEEILTQKQREILTHSLELGYYEFPKKIGLNTLAKKLGLSPSTLCVHLQKIESKILRLNHSGPAFK